MTTTATNETTEPAAHTPGPWAVRVKADHTMMITAPAGHYLARVVGSTAVGDVRGRFTADATLIAAAPDMLDALHLAESFIADRVPNTAEMAHVWLTLRSAIAKATGAQS